MILVLVEHGGGRPDRLSLEALALASRIAAAIGGPLEAVLVGSEAREAAGLLGGRGVELVHAVEHDRLGAFAPAAWSAALVQLIDARSPAAVLAAGSDRGNEVLAHVAARLELPLATQCTDVTPGDPLRLTRQRWAGSLLEDAVLDAPTKLLTVAPHAVAIEDAASGADAASPRVQPFAPDLTESDLRVAVARRLEPDRTGVSLGDARVVIGGGRGVGSAEAFSELEELASLLSGAVGVSRVVTSNGWRPHAMQIGQTGLR
ncbi:MAG TPA: FAD-binding protein, partial [Candidatus Limnocylindrales bacterium]|nr:FAD-binding protein [Candidatus Limnocylindrales bacterium]